MVCHSGWGIMRSAAKMWSSRSVHYTWHRSHFGPRHKCGLLRSCRPSAKRVQRICKHGHCAVHHSRSLGPLRAIAKAMRFCGARGWAGCISTSGLRTPGGMSTDGGLEFSGVFAAELTSRGIAQKTTDGANPIAVVSYRFPARKTLGANLKDSNPVQHGAGFLKIPGRFNTRREF